MFCVETKFFLFLCRDKSEINYVIIFGHCDCLIFIYGYYRVYVCLIIRIYVCAFCYIIIRSASPLLAQKTLVCKSVREKELMWDCADAMWWRMRRAAERRRRSGAEINTEAEHETELFVVLFERESRRYTHSRRLVSTRALWLAKTDFNSLTRVE